MTLLMRKLRLGLKKSQAQVSRDTGLNQSTVNQIENERLRPYPSQLARLAEALGVAKADAASLLEQVSDD